MLVGQPGALTVSTDLTRVAPALELAAPADAAPMTIGFDGALSFADRFGRWRFDGAVAVDKTISKDHLALDYQGVHTRGATPVAWLTIVEAFAAGERGRRGRPNDLRVEGHLNAQRHDGRPDRSASGPELARGETVSPADPTGSGRLIMHQGQ